MDSASSRGSPHTGVQEPVAIIGAGFCGLSAAYELALRGIPAVVFERDHEIGGLAGSFEVDGVQLDKYYHHWFMSDHHVMRLIDELGLRDRVVERATQTGLYYANRQYRLSTPGDLLRFDALSWVDRVRLGLMTLRARRTSDWRALEPQTALEWSRRTGGRRVHDVVWEPLLRGKFGEYADEVSAVWLWNKLRLRGGSRGRGGSEHLRYYRGGFSALAEEVAQRTRQLGGRIETGCPVEGLEQEAGRVVAVVAGGRRHPVSHVLATGALPDIAALVRPHVDAASVEALERIRYLGSVCIVLELDRSLSGHYWLSVNDPSFPFVGIIEHTNLERAEAYGGRHIVYLSAYLPDTARLFRMADHDVVAHALAHVSLMFPEFAQDWVLDSHVWRARHAQPIVELGYHRLLDAIKIPLGGFAVATMAQIYPQDRGTNYAIRQGRAAARAIAEEVVA